MSHGRFHDFLFAPVNVIFSCVFLVAGTLNECSQICVHLFRLSLWGKRTKGNIVTLREGIVSPASLGGLGDPGLALLSRPSCVSLLSLPPAACNPSSRYL